ncbi:MAG: choice-of-anchor J domain-containing protein [Taibaiella sp.]|nr:choice-of-anchor J domain-containing protein [Taibaiella sp.]
MKKILLSLTVMSALALSATAQTRRVLYEEFTGENCGPCASTNPTLLSLMTGGTNPSKVTMIKYMSPIPSAGQFYYQNQSQTDARISYYSVPFAPYGRMDGAVPSISGCTSPGHPACMTQAVIDGEAATTAPFNITVTGTWSPNYDSVTANVTVTATSGYTGSAVYLRVALVDDVYWPIAPGNNTEKMFENVVRKMYPDATGTSVPLTWTIGMTRNYIIKGAVPGYVDRHGANTSFVAWVQNDGDKSVAQAAKSSVFTATLPIDIASDSLSGGLLCASGTPSVTLTNVGTTAISAATIYYKLDAGAWSTQPWTGTLAAGASTIVNITIPTSGAGGYHAIYDSIVVAGDLNPGNASSYGTFFLEKPGYALSAVSTDFEASTLPAGYYAIVNANGYAWQLVNVTISSAPGVSHSGAKAAYFSNPSSASNQVTYFIIPTPTISNPMSITWWTAYAQQSSGTNDQLEFVYSTDCGSTWTSIWSKAGASLATAPITPITNGSTCAGCFLPTSSQWRKDGVNIGTLPANSMLAFRNTSNQGNFLFVDDINAATIPVSVGNTVVINNNINVSPNPAKDMANISLTLATSASVAVDVTDVTGRTVATIAAHTYSAGTQKIELNTASLAAGLYNVKVTAGENVSIQRLSVVK